MQDRVPLYPGRVKLVPVAGQENVYDMVRADQPTQEGTPLNKASLLTDATAALFGLGTDAVPDQVLAVIRGPGAIVRKIKVAEGQTVSAGDVVDVVAQYEYVSGQVSASSLSVGDHPAVLENGSPVEYIIPQIGVPSSIYDSSCNGVWALRKSPLSPMQYDAGNSNVYATSDMHQYINGADLDKFDSRTKSAIKSVKIPYAAGGGSLSVYTGANGLQCNAFLLSAFEFGLDTDGYQEAYGTIPVDGALLSYFEKGDSESAKALRASSVSNFCRTPLSSRTANVFVCSTTGATSSNTAVVSSYAPRPCYIFGDDFYFEGVFKPVSVITKSGTPSQAIALQPGNAGDTIEVIFVGTVFADWITQGQQIISDGVKGAGILPGVLQVARSDSPGIKIVTGSYVGTGSTTDPKSVTLDFSSPPMVVIIRAAVDYLGNAPYGVYGATIIQGILAVNVDTAGSGSPTIKCAFSGNSVTFSSNTGYNGLNNLGTNYRYIAIL